MRSPFRFALSLAAVALSGCTIVVQPGSGAAPTPTPAPEPIVPLEITLARPVNSRLYVQTNRAAHVALFEIVPGQGVTLVQPGSAAQRSVVYSGMTWVPAWWMTQRAAQLGRAQTSTRTRYIYAIASDRPLNLPDGAFQPEGLRSLIGSTAYEGSSPSTTMRALRRFVPAVREEFWAEDMLLLDVATQQQVASTNVRVYCANGTVYVVPVEVADRVYCPVTSTATTPAQPTSPDSVLHDNGRRVRRRPAAPPGRVDRVADLPAGQGTTTPGNGVGRPDDRGNNGRRVGQTDTTNPGRRVGQTDTTNPGRRVGQTEQAGRPATPAADSARAPVLINRMPVLKRDTVDQQPKREPTRSDPEPMDQGRQKSDSSAKPEPAAKPDSTAKPDQAAKADSTAKPDSTGAGRDKPKHDAAADSVRGRGRRPIRP
jgi:hypothetical protein